MAELDLRHINLGTMDVFAAQTRPQAEAFAMACGWRRGDVLRAFNRFWLFWVVGQNYCEGTIRLLSNCGGTVDLSFRKESTDGQAT